RQCVYNPVVGLSFVSSPLWPKKRIIAMSRVAVVPTLTTKRSPPNGEGVHDRGEGCPIDQHPRPVDCIDDPGPDAGRGKRRVGVRPAVAPAFRGGGRSRRRSG